MPEILIVAGEPSGDALAAELVRAAGEIASDVRFFGATGPELESAGAERVVATSELSVMGFLEVVGRLPAIYGAMGRLVEAAEAREPAGAILVDSPDFNLRLAKRLHRRNVPVVQYVAPTVWAWRAGRVGTIRRHVRRLLVTLPFEPEVYESTGVDAVYVGNPAADRVPEAIPPKDEIAPRIGASADAPWVGLLPGSRQAELERMGPLLAAAATRIRDAEAAVELVVPVAPGVDAPAVAAGWWASDGSRRWAPARRRSPPAARSRSSSRFWAFPMPWPIGLRWSRGRSRARWSTSTTSRCRT